MRSKANLRGHPIHPMLVSFPIAFFTGTLILDVLWFFTDNNRYGQAAVYAEAGGIMFAFIAGIPGLIDLIHSVPPRSSAKKRGKKHALLNTIMVAVFATALYLRLNEETNILLLIAIEAAGAILLFMAGWLGGTLIVRNQIGIDHRYAHAGKWREEKVETNNGRVELKEIDQLKKDQMRLYHVGDKRVVVARTDSGIVAFDDYCTHRGASLADGVIICNTVQCPWHGSQFDVLSGDVKAGPAKERIATYRILSEEGKTYLLV